MSTSDQTPARRTYGSHVSRVLGAAGFQRAESETTSVRGYHRYSPGFEVRGCNQSWEESLLDDVERDAGYVTVQCESHDSFSAEAKKPRSEVLDENLPAYLMALEAAGFAVEEREGRRGRYLVVMGRI